MKPDINLHIERLILENLSLQPGEERILQTALEAELRRLIAAGGLNDGWQSGGAVTGLPAATVQISSQQSQSPALIGQQIAHSLYGRIRGGHE